MTSSGYIRSKISEIDHQIAQLHDQRKFFDQLSKQSVIPNTLTEQEIVRTKKSHGKYRTLFGVVSCIRDDKHSASTRSILNFLRKGLGDERNEVTLRSHLRRLREEGHLCYDIKNKVWSLP